jgi:hypothetical protein
MGVCAAQGCIDTVLAMCEGRACHDGCGETHAVGVSATHAVGGTCLHGRQYE